MSLSIVVFSDSDARPAIPFGTFKVENFNQWAQSFHSPKGGTPLGKGITSANAMLEGSKSIKKHILIVTDGENNVEPKPESVIKQMQQKGEFPFYANAIPRACQLAGSVLPSRLIWKKSSSLGPVVPD
jgi:Mg-chelatase subunit ChlD